MKKLVSILLSVIILLNAAGISGIAACANESTKISFSGQTISRPKKVKIISAAENKYGDIKVSWISVNESVGYQIYLSKDIAFKKEVFKITVDSAKSSLSVKNSLLAGRPHYAKIRAFKKVRGKKIYGNWSSVKPIKHIS